MIRRQCERLIRAGTATAAAGARAHRRQRRPGTVGHGASLHAVGTTCGLVRSRRPRQCRSAFLASPQAATHRADRHSAASRACRWSACARSTPADGGRRAQCRRCRLPRRLRECLAVQPRLRMHPGWITDTRHAAAARHCAGGSADVATQDLDTHTLHANIGRRLQLRLLRTHLRAPAIRVHRQHDALPTMRQNRCSGSWGEQLHGAQRLQHAEGFKHMPNRRTLVVELALRLATATLLDVHRVTGGSADAIPTVEGVAGPVQPAVIGIETA